MIVAMLAATILMAESAPATQPTQAAPAEAQAAKKKADDPNRMICHSEPVLGSRMPVKRCVTSQQAEDEKRNAREELEKSQERH